MITVVKLCHMGAGCTLSERYGFAVAAWRDHLSHTGVLVSHGGVTLGQSTKIALKVKGQDKRSLKSSHFYNTIFVPSYVDFVISSFSAFM